MGIRLWPGVAALLLQWFFWLIVPVIVPDGGIYGVIGAIACGVLVVAWWLFFSRAPWLERLGAVALMIAGVAVTFRVVHPSIANGMMGMMLPIFSIPVLCLALVAWAAATRHVSTGVRRISLVAATVLGCAVFTLVRTGGITGAGESDLHWRWTPTPEDRLLARGSDLPAPPSAPAAAAVPSIPVVAPPPPKAAQPEAPAPIAENEEHPAAAPHHVDWSGFRGSNRDGVVHAVRVATDWAHSPPREIWRRPIGPGWSSFAVDGDLLYTQEQRGDDEIVAAYSVSTGEGVWQHRDAARFWESNGGAGPRATPTVGHGRVFTLGATGIVNALDARSGAVLWSRNAASDTGAPLPGWGFAGSPLLLDDIVVVAASGRLIAYDAVSGAPRWRGPVGRGGSYSSPQLATIDGVPQVLMMTGGGITSVAPATGAVLWQHDWPSDTTIVQPAALPDASVLITTAAATGGNGTRRLALAHGPNGWTSEERWTSNGLKPYFNDYVIHRGHAYGFDGNILACLDLADGTRKWKGGRYGNGQMLLLADQDLLLVLSEEGELALVSATPDQFKEISRAPAPALDGKTWNHPVLVRDVLLVRNGEEMAAFRVPIEE